MPRPPGDGVQPEVLAKRDRQRRHDHGHRIVRQKLGQDLRQEVEHEQQRQRRQIRKPWDRGIHNQLRGPGVVHRRADDEHEKDQDEERRADTRMSLLRLLRAGPEHHPCPALPGSGSTQLRMRKGQKWLPARPRSGSWLWNGLFVRSLQPHSRRWWQKTVKKDHPDLSGLDLPLNLHPAATGAGC